MKAACIVFSLIVFAMNGKCQNPVLYTVKYKPLPIYEKPNGKLLIKVPRNKTLTFLSYDKKCDCYNASYQNISGVVNSGIWLDDIYAKDVNKRKSNYNDTLSGDLKRLIAEHIVGSGKGDFIVETGVTKSTDSKRTSELIGKYGYTNGLRISEGKIWLGMNVDMTLDSRGIPYRINRSQGGGVREQWIYSDVYLYFENGALTEIFRIKSN